MQQQRKARLGVKDLGTVRTFRVGLRMQRAFSFFCDNPYLVACGDHVFIRFDFGLSEA